MGVVADRIDKTLPLIVSLLQLIKEESRKCVDNNCGGWWCEEVLVLFLLDHMQICCHVFFENSIFREYFLSPCVDELSFIFLWWNLCLQMCSVHPESTWTGNWEIQQPDIQWGMFESDNNTIMMTFLWFGRFLIFVCLVIIKLLQSSFGMIHAVCWCLLLNFKWVEIPRDWNICLIWFNELYLEFCTCFFVSWFYNMFRINDWCFNNRRYI